MTSVDSWAVCSGLLGWAASLACPASLVFYKVFLSFLCHTCILPAVDTEQRELAVGDDLLSLAMLRKTIPDDVLALDVRLLTTLASNSHL